MGCRLNSKIKIDHRNHNRLDNRRENLRGATDSQNLMNSKKYSNNTSGYKGVTQHKKSKRFRARITVNQKLINIGSYDTALKAARAYNREAKKLHKEFALLNPV